MTLPETYMRNALVVVGGIGVAIVLGAICELVTWLSRTQSAMGLLTIGGFLLAVLVFNAVTLFQYTRENGWDGWCLPWTKRPKY